HPVHKLAHEQVGPTLHEQRDLVDPCPVVLGADAPLARPRTPFDVEVEADLALLEYLVRAGAEREQLPDRLDRRAQGEGRRVRAEVQSAVVLHATRVVDPRKRLGHRELEVEVVLVVLQPDVETRPVVLDEAVLEHQRLDLVGGGDELEVGRPAHELRHARRLGVSSREVLPQPVPQAQRLADVDDLRLGVAKQVNARALRDRLQPRLDRLFEGNRHVLAILGTRKLRSVSEIQKPAPELQGYTPSGTQTNSLAIVSLASAVLSFFAHVIPVVGGFTVALIAIITGFMARGQIRRTGEQGMWMA